MLICKYKLNITEFACVLTFCNKKSLRSALHYLLKVNISFINDVGMPQKEKVARVLNLMKKNNDESLLLCLEGYLTIPLCFDILHFCFFFSLWLIKNFEQKLNFCISLNSSISINLNFANYMYSPKIFIHNFVINKIDFSCLS